MSRRSTQVVMANPESNLPDAAARTRVSQETGSTLFVEAGAGSGKTKSLIDRIQTLVMVDGIPLERIAAVTFTEKAGAELRDRLRATFDPLTSDSDGTLDGGARTQRAEDALDAIDSASIGTLHSFAQRILTQFPIEAGLPPLVEVLDEVSSSVAFDERWSILQRKLLDDPELSDPLLLAMSAGVALEHLRSLAKAFGSDWDLIEDRVLSVPPATAVMPDVSDLLLRAEALAERADDCTKEGDRFLEKLAALGTWATSFRSALTDSDRFVALNRAGELKWGYGITKNWPDLAGLKVDCKSFQEDAAALVAEFADATLRPLAYWIAREVRASADLRAAEGRLEFHDLLVLARQLLRSNADVREELQQRYRTLLLDEFQDTDPIQIELAVRIVGGRDADAADWREIAVPAGSLFLVGDPKQSIYRFRRADIALFLQVQQWVGGAEELSTNFRTVAPILDWTNRVFGELIKPVADAQPAYRPLDAFRADVGSGPAVLLAGVDVHLDKPDASVLREREATDVAAIINRARSEAWTVWDERAKNWRPLRLADIAILLPARTSLPFLEDKLEHAGIAYRAESSSLVYQADEVRNLLAAARAIADPTDLLSCVSALRSPLFGCGDDDLWEWKRAGGSFNLLAPHNDSLPQGHVREALSYLRRLHRESRWMAPSELLSTLVADRRMLEVAASGPRPQDSWRRVRFVVDQARAWSDAERNGLREYLAWANRQGQDASRVAESVLPELDLDAVRIMTVHAAKGLEFPMVILSGMSSVQQGRPGVKLLWPAAGGYSVRLNKSVQTNDFEVSKPLDEQMDQYERLRLMYVAATRARDHLVVSMHRKEGGATTNATLLAKAGAADVPGVEPFVLDGGVEAASANAPVEATVPMDWDEWLAGITAVRDASRKRSTISASGLEGTEPEVVFGVVDETAAEPEGSAKGPRDVELPPWAKGRYGSAVGRAVHGVLQTIDLATGDGVEQAVAAQCVAEGVEEFVEIVRGYVDSALASDVVKTAVRGEYWRETFVGYRRDDGILVEGIIDLMYREADGGLVIVDYKTDDIPAAAIPVRASFYGPQVAAYVAGIQEATGATPSAVLLFLNPSGTATAVRSS